MARANSLVVPSSVPAPTNPSRAASASSPAPSSREAALSPPSPRRERFMTAAPHRRASFNAAVDRGARECMPSPVDFFLLLFGHNPSVPGHDWSTGGTPESARVRNLCARVALFAAAARAVVDPTHAKTRDETRARAHSPPSHARIARASRRGRRLKSHEGFAQSSLRGFSISIHPSIDTPPSTVERRAWCARWCILSVTMDCPCRTWRRWM